MLKIDQLKVVIEEKVIINGLSLEIKPGQIHAIMGPNGAGKSTLARVLAGDPTYEVISGSVTFNGEDLLEMDIEDRARSGLFLSFQYPVEIPGVSTLDFLYAASKSELTKEAFEEKMLKIVSDLGFKKELLTRDLNTGFSGGEKKQNEIIQMAALNPKLALLDETDSGLDIDALRTVAKGVNQLMSEEKGLLVITHYQRLLDYIVPDVVHVMVDGEIRESGGPELALKLEEKGYTHALS